MRIGIIGSGSWATALAKIVTDNGHPVHWWIRNEQTIQYFQKRRHNPHYLSSVYFDLSQIHFYNSLPELIASTDCIVLAVPAAFIHSLLGELPVDVFRDKKIISAVKGILPEENELLNQYLERSFSFSLSQYFTLLGPCHAEEVAAEKLSYLTLSGTDKTAIEPLAAIFNNEYVFTHINMDIWGVQYAAVLKNIYALGAGIVHGLEYGDNFLSVFISNAAKEVVQFLGAIDKRGDALNDTLSDYAGSVYLGDLLVTCYSLHSRNRTFGNMIGKGYSVTAARLELNMVAEGYYAARCIHSLNQKLGCDMPIAKTIYEILWNQLPAANGIHSLESRLV
ncbi:MAG: NAD(P)-binding domain-containing protein [Bacteroidetes bacterium]|nr:NAD(P)-binding domain-containing protein [Bacteroidota bacterium]